MNLTEVDDQLNKLKERERQAQIDMDRRGLVDGFENRRDLSNITDINIGGNNRDELQSQAEIESIIGEDKGTFKDKIEQYNNNQNGIIGEIGSHTAANSVKVSVPEYNRADTGEADDEPGSNNVSQIQIQEVEQKKLQADFDRMQTMKAEKANRCATCCSEVACMPCISRKESIQRLQNSSMKPLTQPRNAGNKMNMNLGTD